MVSDYRDKKIENRYKKEKTEESEESWRRVCGRGTGKHKKTEINVTKEPIFIKKQLLLFCYKVLFYRNKGRGVMARSRVAAVMSALVDKLTRFGVF